MTGCVGGVSNNGCGTDVWIEREDTLKGMSGRARVLSFVSCVVDTVGVKVGTSGEWLSQKHCYNGKYGCWVAKFEGKCTKSVIFLFLLFVFL